MHVPGFGFKGTSATLQTGPLAAPCLSFPPMSVMPELRRGVRADRSQGQIEPCLPRAAKNPPAGAGWIHEIKHDGFRIMVRRDSNGVRLITRNGRDFSGRFPFIALAVAALPTRSCLIDGEASSAMTTALPCLTSSASGGRMRTRSTVRSTYSNSTVKTFAACRSRSVNKRYRSCCAVLIQAS